MDLLDVTVFALRIALVGVLYGFLLFVLRSAGRSLQTTWPAAAAQPSGRLDLRLIVLVPGGSGLTENQAVDVADGATLGRADRADVVVADAAISAEHARVVRVHRDWVVRDLGSTNGTLINGSRVTGQSPLHHGDVLTLGGVQFKVALRAASGNGQG